MPTVFKYNNTINMIYKHSIPSIVILLCGIVSDVFCELLVWFSQIN